MKFFFVLSIIFVSNLSAFAAEQSGSPGSCGKTIRQLWTVLKPLVAQRNIDLGRKINRLIISARQSEEPYKAYKTSISELLEIFRSFDPNLDREPVDCFMFASSGVDWDSFNSFLYSLEIEGPQFRQVVDPVENQFEELKLRVSNILSKAAQVEPHQPSVFDRTFRPNKTPRFQRLAEHLTYLIDGDGSLFGTRP